MKFNREHLEELTLQKIKEVNDEAGYRSYLEVPEMVNIIASIMEEKMMVFHDSDAELIRSLRAHIDTLNEEEDEYFRLKIITDKILREFPVGNITEHTIESIPERISYYLKELAEYTQRVEDLEDKKLDPKQPICTKCVNNLTYYDGWHCMCELNDIDEECWVNFDERDKKILEEDKKILQDEIVALRAVISKISCNLGNGSVVSEDLLKDVARYDNGYHSMIQYPNGDYVKYADVVDLFKKSYEEEIEKLKAEIASLKQRNEKLSKRHPTTEEALAQYHWLKANSKRNK